MSDIVIAVAKCSLSIFPRFSPMNRGQAEEEGAGWERSQQAGESIRREFCA
jgi:hypothetical protein